MALDPRLPVIIGVGQVNHTGGDGPEPVELLAEAARRAVADSGGVGVLGALQSVRVVNLLSRRYTDPGALVAEHLGVDVGETIYTTAGGQTPQALIDRSAVDIAAGGLDVVLIGGAEAWKTRNRYRSRGERAAWTTQSADAHPTMVLGRELVMTDEHETALGFVDPVQAYPMFEHALRATAGRSLPDQVARGRGAVGPLQPGGHGQPVCGDPACLYRHRDRHAGSIQSHGRLPLSEADERQ